MSKLNDLVVAVVADSVVDAAEVQKLRAEMYADGKIDMDEANAMFQINDAVTGNANDESYKDLFVDVLSDFVLKDDISPGVVDNIEGQYLVDKIQGDGALDDIEKALLLNIKAKATSIESEALNIMINSL